MLLDDLQIKLPNSIQRSTKSTSHSQHQTDQIYHQKFQFYQLFPILTRFPYLPLNSKLSMATVLRTPTFRPLLPPRSSAPISSRFPKSIYVSFKQSSSCRPSPFSSLRLANSASPRFVKVVAFAFDGKSETTETQEPEIQVFFSIYLSIYLFFFLVISSMFGLVRFRFCLVAEEV